MSQAANFAEAYAGVAVARVVGDAHRPALSLPLPVAGGLPVGLMVVGRRGRDRELLAVGAAIEKVLAAG